MPVAEVDTESGKLTFKKHPDGKTLKTPFPLLCHPVALTLGIYKSQLIFDLTRQEERLLDCALTVVVDDSGNVHSTIPTLDGRPAVLCCTSR